MGKMQTYTSGVSIILGARAVHGHDGIYFLHLERDKEVRGNYVGGDRGAVYILA